MTEKQEVTAELNRKISALESVFSDIFGPDQLILRGTKLELIEDLGSEDCEARLSALEKIIFYDASYEGKGTLEERLELLAQEMADLIARRELEDQLEKVVNDRLQEKQDEYYREVKIQVLKEQSGPENATTQRKQQQLDEVEQRGLDGKSPNAMRPSALSEIVGQERAVSALLGKLTTPYPQHIIIYGPPGVGKTTAARLALDEAKQIASSAFRADAPFVEVDGATLRWDPRDTTNPLLGSVHDPIYQGARRDLAETGIPEPKPGLVTDANGGILFIDEIGEMDPILLNKLLKVLEDKRVTFDSSYYDEGDEMVPAYIRQIFNQGLPADFILIGATTREPAEISSALRSRCSAVYFDPLSPVEIEEIVKNAAARLQIKIDDDAAAMISAYTSDGRQAVNLLADAYGLLTYQQRFYKQKRKTVKKTNVEKVLRNARITPLRKESAQAGAEVGKIAGLGVYGFLGSVLEIEAIAFPAGEKGKGTVRFNETAGSMAKDSVFNAASVYRLVTGANLADYDLHINVVGGGNIDGPSAGLAVFLVIYSSITGKPLPQDVAVTGELSVRGRVCPVGGIPEKLFGAAQAGMKTVILPKANREDVPADFKQCKLQFVESIADVMKMIFK